jgi:hypothetical protein
MILIIINTVMFGTCNTSLNHVFFGLNRKLTKSHENRKKVLPDRIMCDFVSLLFFFYLHC